MKTVVHRFAAETRVLAAASVVIVLAASALMLVAGADARSFATLVLSPVASFAIVFALLWLFAGAGWIMHLVMMAAGFGISAAWIALATVLLLMGDYGGGQTAGVEASLAFLGAGWAAVASVRADRTLVRERGTAPAHQQSPDA